MSSQGPVGDTSITKGPPPFHTGPTGGTPGSSNYTFSTASIRDASDWLAYKKQAIIFRENKATINQNQWTQYGNDYRIQWQLGRHKTAGTGCTGCSADSFGGTGPY